MFGSYALAGECQPRHGTECEYRRRHGGQPGNRNGVTHGQHTRHARAARKASHAIVKAAAHLIVAHGLSPHRVRPCPVRGDQMALLLVFAPDIARAMEEHLPRGFRAGLGFGYAIRCRHNIGVTTAGGETRPAAQWVGTGGHTRIRGEASRYPS